MKSRLHSMVSDLLSEKTSFGRCRRVGFFDEICSDLRRSYASVREVYFELFARIALALLWGLVATCSERRSDELVRALFYDG